MEYFSFATVYSSWKRKLQTSKWLPTHENDFALLLVGWFINSTSSSIFLFSPYVEESFTSHPLFIPLDYPYRWHLHHSPNQKLGREVNRDSFILLCWCVHLPDLPLVFLRVSYLFPLVFHTHTYCVCVLVGKTLNFNSNIAEMCECVLVITSIALHFFPIHWVWMLSNILWQHFRFLLGYIPQHNETIKVSRQINLYKFYNFNLIVVSCSFFVESWKEGTWYVSGSRIHL